AQAAEDLDLPSSGADRYLPDRAGHDLVVAEAPDRHALVPLGQELGELVEVLVLAPARVDLDQREAALAPELRERLRQVGRDAPHLAETRRVEPGAVPEHLAERVVLPRRHLREGREARCRVLHTVATPQVG